MTEFVALSSGVGSGACQWAAQMAKIKGYKVIGTTSKSKEAVGARHNRPIIQPE